jgi:hypothetical protein
MQRSQRARRVGVAFPMSPGIKRFRPLRAREIVCIKNERLPFGVEDTTKWFLKTSVRYVCNVLGTPANHP